MKVRGLKSFSTIRYGDVDSSREFECDPGLAKQWAEAGMVEIVDGGYETKVVVNEPKSRPRKKDKKD